MLVSTVQWSEVEFSVLHSRFSLVIYFVHISVVNLYQGNLFIGNFLKSIKVSDLYNSFMGSVFKIL